MRAPHPCGPVRGAERCLGGTLSTVSNVSGTLVQVADRRNLARREDAAAGLRIAQRRPRAARSQLGSPATSCTLRRARLSRRMPQRPHTGSTPGLATADGARPACAVPGAGAGGRAGEELARAVAGVARDELEIGSPALKTAPRRMPRDHPGWSAEYQDMIAGRRPEPGPALAPREASTLWPGGGARLGRSPIGSKSEHAPGRLHADPGTHVRRDRRAVPARRAPSLPLRLRRVGGARARLRESRCVIATGPGTAAAWFATVVRHEAMRVGLIDASRITAFRDGIVRLRWS
jgi:hypothetical protein